ncbi:MAG: hypothetical protein GXO26_00585, partial [Crenarchaeota archaeon]|nr:hypothetical protein [Thermoproteota archaeon]
MKGFDDTTVHNTENMLINLSNQGSDKHMEREGIGKTILRELKENPGRPFIIAFMVLLIIAAAELAIGNTTIANKLAEIAYYYLVIGVILTIATIVREERKKARESSKEGASGPSTAVSRGLSDPSTAVGVGVF